MLTCSHNTQMARKVADLARQGRFPDALEGGLSVLSAHPTGSRCRSRFAADLLPIAVATDHAQLAEVLVLIVRDDDVLYMPQRVDWMAAAVDAWASAWHGQLDQAKFLLPALRTIRWQPLDRRLLLAEIDLRCANDAVEPDEMPALGGPLLGAQRRARINHAAVGYGLAVRGRWPRGTGSAWLIQLARNLERGDPGLPTNPHLSETQSFAAALNRWSWARAVLGQATTTDDVDWTRNRILMVARYFAGVGNQLGAAMAYARAAQLHEDHGDRIVAAHAAASALGETESRFLVLAVGSKVEQWRETTSIAREVGLKVADNDDDRRVFRAFDSRCGWMGIRTTLDGRVAASSDAFRALFVHAGPQQFRATFEDMLRRAVRPMIIAGAGGPLIRELVRMEREDAQRGDNNSIWLARALTTLAVHHADNGDNGEAIAADTEAREIFMALDSDDARREADTALRGRIGRLLSANRWTDAVRLAVQFDGARVDPVALVRERARHARRLDVVEQLAAYRVESARLSHPAVLVGALCDWATIRDELEPWSGSPVFAEAVKHAESLARDDVGYNDLLIHTQMKASRYRPSEALDDLWHRILTAPLTDRLLFATLTNLVATDDKDAATTVSLLTAAAERILADLMTTPDGHPRSLRPYVLRWSDTIQDLGAVTAAVKLLTALAALPMQHRSDQAMLRTELASALLALADYGAAEAELVQALDLDPDHAGAHRTLGILHLEMGCYEQARLALDRSLELEPKRAWTYVLRGETMHRLGDYDAAIEDLAAASRLSPRYEEPALQLARVFRTIKAPERGLATLTAQGAATSSRDWSRYQYGLALAETGYRPDANQFFVDALEIGSTPLRTVGPWKRTGDPNIGLYMLALGRNEDATKEFSAAINYHTSNRVKRELAEDLDELAVVLPERRTTAMRIKRLLNDRDLTEAMQQSTSSDDPGSVES